MWYTWPIRGVWRLYSNRSRTWSERLDLLQKNFFKRKYPILIPRARESNWYICRPSQNISKLQPRERERKRKGEVGKKETLNVNKMFSIYEAPKKKINAKNDSLICPVLKILNSLHLLFSKSRKKKKLVQTFMIIKIPSENRALVYTALNWGGPFLVILKIFQHRQNKWYNI